MARLHALQYFVEAAQAKSFSGAARVLDVSVQAVIKGVKTLEADLDTVLFERTPRGLRLTASGASYLEACKPALSLLEQADERARTATRDAEGTVVAVVTNVIARFALVEALPRFHAQYPRIQLDLRDNRGDIGTAEAGIDVYVTMGWSANQDLARRQIARTRLWVVAAPDYWARYGVPKHPDELSRHNCIVIRNTPGTAMDLWEFTRGNERASVAVSGWLVVSNGHRDVAMDTLLAGQGVVRSGDWSLRRWVDSGRLIRVLPDWDAAESPPVTLMYVPKVRRIPRVRAFMEFAEGAFRGTDARRENPVHSTDAPDWMRRGYPRASTLITRSRSKKSR
jgi:DNA-binding transcriptional LysR family regulator